MLQRLALVTETYPPEVNGVAMTLNRLSRHLTDRGIDLQVVHPTPRSRVQWGVRGTWRTLHVPGFPIPGYPEAQVGLPAFLKLRRAWRESRPDVVHVATEGLLGLAAARTAHHLGIPLITSFHTNFHEYARHYHAPWMKPVVIAYLRSLHAMARVNLVPDPDLIRDLQKLGFGACRFFGRGVDTTLFNPQHRDLALRATWGAEPIDPVFLHVSRVAAEKNIPLVIESVKRFREKVCSRARLVIVGDGPEYRPLQRRYPDVIFTGMKFDDDLARHYASADFFCFASETETFGNVIPEAMASGLVVLTYDYAAGRQIISHGIDGLLVPLGDADSFSRAVLDLHPDLTQHDAMRRAARERSLLMPWSMVVDEYLAVVDDALKT